MEVNIFPHIVIVGSGASGVHAAEAALDAGARVTMVDVGLTQPAGQRLLPRGDFTTLRSTDTEQYKYLIGEDFESISFDDIRQSNKLMPLRRHVISHNKLLTYLTCDGFVATKSFALGGLAQSWGAGAVPFSESDLRDWPINKIELDPHYNAVSRTVGISGNFDSLTKVFEPPEKFQPGLDLDSQSEILAKVYENKKKAFQKAGAFLGRAWLAVSSEKRNAIQDAYLYSDTEFWGDSDQSVYRPVWTLKNLLKHPKFTYLSNRLVESFEEHEKGVKLKVSFVDNGKNSGARTEVYGDRLILCAGCFGTPQIVLQSFKAFGHRLPILSNPYAYIPCFHPRLFGFQPRDRRSSFSQLSLHLTATDLVSPTFSSVFSYRSLLTYRLMRETPLPKRIALDLFRILMPSIAIVTVFHEDLPGSEKHIELLKLGSEQNRLNVFYRYNAGQEAQIKTANRRVTKTIRQLGLLPLRIISRSPGSSIHSGGALPMSTEYYRGRPFTTCPETGRLAGTNRVHIADASIFPTMPSTPLTFTLMANARRIGSWCATQP